MWGCGARWARSRAVPPPGPILRALPRSPGEPQLSAGPDTLLPPVPLRGDRFHARGCNKLQEHRTHSREGRAVFIVVFFVSFHPGEGREWPRSQCPRSMSISLTSPHGRRREAFPRAELGGRHAPSPGAAGRVGAWHAGTCSPPPAGGAGVRGLGPPGSGEVRKGGRRAGAL